MNITDKMIKASCSPTIYKRGTEYFLEGRVHLKKYDDTHISAAVDDSNIFMVNVEFNTDRITKSFCTCPYYQTMHSPCKHIIAAMKQRQKELNEGGAFRDVNDRIAEELCGTFAADSLPKVMLSPRFIMHIKRTHGFADYCMEIALDNSNESIDGIDSFLECFIRGREFKFGKNYIYIPNVTNFQPDEEAVIRILAGVYLDRRANTSSYTKAIYRTPFSGAAAARIFPHLKNTEVSVTVDGVPIQDIMFAEDNPDILIDVDATDSDISLSLYDRGLSLTEDGEWFLYENTVYHTSEEWRGYFMPIYSAFAAENRMQITFKGSNRLGFARHIMPKLNGMHGVVMQGVEELIINEIPLFEVYLDAAKNAVTAVIIAHYGGVAIRLIDDYSKEEKIIVRDTEAETAVLTEFEKFSYNNGTFTLTDDDDIFNFVKNSLPRLTKLAKLFYSKPFEALFSADDVSLSLSVNYNEKIDLLETDFESSLTDEELWRIIRAIQLDKSFYRLNDGRFLDFEARADDFNMLYRLDFSEADVKNGGKLIDKYYALYLDTKDNIVKRSSFRALLEDMRHASAAVPEGLTNVLRDYQKDGMTWLKQLSFMGFGGILADDMGLGKTLQVLAYIHGERVNEPTLIITPSSLMYNWLNEINRFIPDAKAIIIDGPREERERKFSKINDYEFIITSYPYLRRDTAMYKNTEFEYLFIDEAQYIKNARTVNARAVKCINARHRFAVTGTPIENSLNELWSIFDFIMPGYLYSHNKFRELYEYPIMHGTAPDRAVDLRNRIKPFIMRRMKTEVLTELPERIENTIYADLTPPQKTMYMAYLEIARRETAEALSEGGAGKMKILTLLLRLRQICCHPYLADTEYSRDSGKLNLLLELMEAGISGGHRILIFSQFTSMLKIISKELDRRNTGYFYLDGQTPAAERAAMSERFNNGEKNVFLISLKAGGTGLNLTGADMVIHYDPWWNPAVTDQASDRAYRLGQTRAVQIIRLATRGTIEEKILRLQEAKRSLADDIITANSTELSSLSNEEIMSLFD